ncbi:SDR family oxidoreductase [Oerskovia turbata]|uniref:SDR family oxidoreductase n=1 Tax=Oerskovia turbata TaxID=1713 RepID=A0A4V1N4A0_9CELL|nr:SDR family oxidoreductase [Oerskovia turbata]RXR21766.1 SDR family oxidoreductase [Oerskovia turbata]RXR31436.1 SDR family oxidoreductase [Oerskovia turbata]TGJ95963.1 SDR family NAD(P)-dependent oxidoreductase [Actinotalea fermentans ATCC 43279 = JCM 9966 = DSM 3133]
MTIRTDSGIVAVTGASGQLGSKLAMRLAAEGAAQRLVVRDAARTPRLPDGAPLPDSEVAVTAGYTDTERMVRAFRGARSVFLVSAREAPDRVAEHRAAVDAAVAAGVERIVYVSFVGASPEATFTFARDHWHTEEYIEGTGLRYTFLRDNLYHQGLVHMVGDDGVIRGPGGDGRLASVSHDDIADVATAILLDERPHVHDGKTYDVTGPEALTLTEVASVLSGVTGRTITYHPETIEEAYASRAVYAAPPFEVDGWVSSYTAIAAGELAGVSDVVERFAGRPAQGLAAWLDDYPEEWDRLLPA